MTRESVEVFRLEFDDDWLGEVGLEGEGCWLASVVGAMTELFAHETVRVMTVVGSFSDCFISLKIACPTQSWPTDSSHCRVDISDSTASRYLQSLKRFPSIAPTT